jgi:hypothetical protein
MAVQDAGAALQRVPLDVPLAAEALPDLRPFPDAAEILHVWRWLDADRDAALPVD